MGKHIVIKDLSTSNNKPIEVHDDLPRVPFSMAVIGPSRSGKSNLIKNLFLRRDLYSKVFKPENVFIFCQSIDLNDDFDDFNVPDENKYDHWEETVVKGIYKDASKIIKDYGKRRMPHILLICDDVFDDSNFVNSKILPLLFMRGRHLKISMVVSGQKFSSIPRGARLNITDLICFRPYSANELDFILNETCSRINRKQVFSYLNDIFIEPYQFVYYDFLNKDPYRRIRKGFSENLNFN